MDTFSEVYEKSIELLKTQSLDASWKSIETSLKLLLKADGPDANNAGGLQDVRDYLRELSKGKSSAALAHAEAILVACKPGTPGFQARAAFVKTMRHFYLVQKKGNQSVWVIDPPRSFAAWPYDQFDGKGEAAIKSDLQMEDEVFGADSRQMMSDALQLARKWSMDVQIKLADAVAGEAMVRRWFHADGDDAQAVSASTAILLNGFKKISAACNSTRVTFSDLPHLRGDFEGDGTIAAVAAGEAMPVIYLFKEFLNIARPNKMGVVPKLWLCALTIIHELSHSLIQTEDIRYDYQGLKVGPAFSGNDALKNADSWGHLAADMVGALPESDRNKALK